MYLLLHGAWHASWCWDRITPILSSHGHQVIAVDLPGHGNDKTSLLTINLKTYVDAIIDTVMTCDRPVTLVGHSMAGVVISAVAEKIPDRIDELIYVSAFIPRDKESLIEQASQAKTAGISSHMIIDPAQNTIDLKPSDQLAKLFYNRCTAEDTDYALSMLQTQAFQPFTDPVHLSDANWGRVRKRYVVCMSDTVFRPEDQERIAMQAGCEITRIQNADHSPFFSTVEELAGVL